MNIRKTTCRVEYTSARRAKYGSVMYQSTSCMYASSSAETYDPLPKLAPMFSTVNLLSSVLFKRCVTCVVLVPTLCNKLSGPLGLVRYLVPPNMNCGPAHLNTTKYKHELLFSVFAHNGSNREPSSATTTEISKITTWCGCLGVLLPNIPCSAASGCGTKKTPPLVASYSQTPLPRSSAPERPPASQLQVVVFQ